MKTINITIIMLLCVTNMLVAQEEDTNYIKSPICGPTLGVFTQEKDTNDVNKSISATVIEDMVYKVPTFPGGEEARMKFLMDSLIYPEQDAEGTVYVTFVVEADGSLTDVKVLRGIGGGCDEEAVRLVKLMPKWNPGTQDGKPVRVQFSLPIKFIRY